MLKTTHCHVIVSFASVSLWKLLRVLCINCLTSVDPSFRLFVHVLSRICGILRVLLKLVVVASSPCTDTCFDSPGDANSFQWDSANFVEAVLCVSQLFLSETFLWVHVWLEPNVPVVDGVLVSAGQAEKSISVCCSFDLAERMCDRSRWPIYFFKIFLHLRVPWPHSVETLTLLVPKTLQRNLWQRLELVSGRSLLWLTVDDAQADSLLPSSCIPFAHKSFLFFVLFLLLVWIMWRMLSQKERNLCLSKKTRVSIPVGVWWMRTTHSGFCAVFRKFPDPWMKSSVPDTWLFPSRRRKYCDLDLVTVDFFLSVWLLAGKNLRFVGLDFYPLRFRAPFWFFLKELANRRTSSASLRFDMQAFVFVSQFDATALLLPNPNVFLHCWLENRIEQRAAEKISLFRASSNLEFITFHDRQQSGALVSMQTFRKQMCCSLVEWFRRDLQIASCRIESNGVLKIDRCLPDVCSHSLHFRTMSLYAIRWSVVWIFWKPTKVKKIGSCRACCAVL